jgi:hypothetical protein
VGQEPPQTFLFMQPLKLIEHLGILLRDTRDVCGAYIDSTYAIAQPKTAGGRRSGLSTALALTSLPLVTPRRAGRWKNRPESALENAAGQFALTSLPLANAYRLGDNDSFHQAVPK